MKAFKIIVFLIVSSMFLCGCFDNFTTTSRAVFTSNITSKSSNTSKTDIVSTVLTSSDIVTSIKGETSSNIVTSIKSETSSSATTSKDTATSSYKEFPYVSLNIPMIDSKEFDKLIEFNSNLEEARKIFPKNSISNKRSWYKITLHCKDRVGYIFFFEDGRISGSDVHYKTSLKSTDFNSSLMGKSLVYIGEKFDPNGDYPFLYVSTDKLPKESYHYTADGYIITITYSKVENVHVVTDVILEKL